MKELTINGKHYFLENVSGIVADSSKNMETKVSGGGGSINKGSGFIAPVMSHTIVHDQIFLIDNLGREKAFDIQGMNVACRAGHSLTLTQLTNQKNNKTEFIAAANLTTQQVYFNTNALIRLYEPNYWKVMLYSFGGGTLPFLLGGMFFIFAIFLGLCLGGFIFVAYLLYSLFINQPRLANQFTSNFRLEEYN